MVLWLTLLLAVPSRVPRENGRKKKNFEPGPESVLFLALFQVTILYCRQLTSGRITVWIKMFPCHLLTFFICEFAMQIVLLLLVLLSDVHTLAEHSPPVDGGWNQWAGFWINQPLIGSPVELRPRLPPLGTEDKTSWHVLLLLFIMGQKQIKEELSTKSAVFFPYSLSGKTVMKSWFMSPVMWTRPAWVQSMGRREQDPELQNVWDDFR